MATQHVLRVRTSTRYNTRKATPRAKAETRARREVRSVKTNNGQGWV